jgi:hypothetical protein
MAKANSNAAASSTPTQAATAQTKRAPIKSFDLTDLRIVTLNGENFTAGRHDLPLSLLKKRQHIAAFPVVSLLESLGITDPEAIVTTVKADNYGRVSRLYGLEIVRSKDGSQILFRAGEQYVPLKQQGDKLVAEQAQGGISFEMKSRLNSTEKYLIAKVTLTTKVNPANYAVLLSLEMDLKDEEGNPIDTASLLQSDFNQGNYDTLLELLAPPKDPPIAMHELPVGAYKVLAVAEPVFKKGTRKDGQPWSLNSYAITIEVDGNPAVTYSSDDIMRQLDGIHAGLKQAGVEYDPSDVLELVHIPYWLQVKDVQIKNPDEVEDGREPKYKVIATLTDSYPMQFSAADAGE